MMTVISAMSSLLYQALMLRIRLGSNIVQTWLGKRINVGDTKNVALELSVDTYTKEEFRKLHLPDGMSFPVEQQGNGGCLSFIIMLLIPTITLLYFL